MRLVQGALVCLLYGGQAVAAEEAVPQHDTSSPANAPSTLGESAGMVMLTYQKITLTNGGKFDLYSTHYLHQLNDWIYFGAGISAPLVEGNYGGFFSGDVTLHAQKTVFGNWFVDAGLSFGAGAGGASITNIRDLSGTGLYLKKYVGLGYEGEHFNFGVNYADINIANSPVNDSVISFFVQKPLSASVGSYADRGNSLDPAAFGFLGGESIVSVEYSNLNQIDPVGKYGGDIGLVSPQFSHFFTDDDYVFFGLDLGYSGLVWYNQFQAGYGRRISLTPNINLYGQLGIGSGGWVTDTIDTGPGLVVYPKAKAEYLWSNGIGAFLSAGYLVAPKGSSKNWSIGAGVNYHFPSAKQALSPDSSGYDVALKGARINVFERKVTDIVYNGAALDDLNLTAIQFDYNLNDSWYVPVQVAAAKNDFLGFAGYVEGFAGLGWQSDIFGLDRLSGYAQVMYGMNDVGVNAKQDVGPLLYPSIGFTYDLNDRYSIYGQFGKTVSLSQYTEPNFTNFFEGVSIGLGVSYRFGVPVWKSN